MAARPTAPPCPAGLDDAGWRRLCLGIRAGDERAFGEFYDRWFPRALQLARAVTRADEALGLDIVQDVMLKVVHRLPALAGERAVAAWMAKTISATAIDRCRSEQRRLRREQHAARGERVDDDTLQAMGQYEQLSWLRAQLLALPSDERVLLQQRFHGDASMGELAASLGLTVDAVHGRVRRLLLRLQRAAKDWMSDA